MHYGGNEGLALLELLGKKVMALNVWELLKLDNVDHLDEELINVADERFRPGKRGGLEHLMDRLLSLD